MMAAFACVGAGTNGQAAPPSRPTLMEIEHLIRYAPLAVGLMEIEHLIRYAPLAVGVNPSASQGEARLRGLERIISSKTISVGLIAQRALPRPHTGGCACGGTSPAGAGLRALSADVMEIENLIRYAPLAVGVNPSASQGEARLRGLERIISSKTISVGLMAPRALPRPHTGGCACGGTSPAGAGLRALSADVHARAGVARPGGCACGGASPAVPPDAEPSG